ncbi:hypothetical protein GM3709_150 [Geminocystis sp. NIES-3709]|nr:hypothetical protein GM3709_150 [Geminocystis sp. NIES-3709]
MSRNLIKIQKNLRLLIIALIPITVILYLLRGLGFLGFLSGGILLFLIIASFFSLVTFLIIQTYS